jgi:hypothetical protein
VYLEIGADGYFQIGYQFNIDGVEKLANGEIGPEVGFVMKGSAGLDATVARAGIELSAFLLLHELKVYAELKLDSWPLDVCAGVRREAKPLDVSMRAWYQYWFGEWEAKEYIDLASWAIPSDGTTIQDTLFEICSTQANQAPKTTGTTFTINEDASGDAIKGICNAVDPEGDRIVFSITATEGPFGASLSNVNNGEFVLAAQPNAHGTGAIIFIANDGSLDSDPASVSVIIEAVADLPVLRVRDAIGDEDLPLELNMETYVTDADGSEELRLTVGNIPEGARLLRNCNHPNPADCFLRMAIGEVGLDFCCEEMPLSSLQIEGTFTEGVPGDDAYYTLSPEEVGLLRKHPKLTDDCGSCDLIGYEPICVTDDWANASTAYYTPCNAVICAGKGGASFSHGMCPPSEYDTGNVYSILPKRHWNGVAMLTITGTSREKSNGDEASVHSSLRLEVRAVNDGPLLAGLGSFAGTGLDMEEDRPQSFMLSVVDVDAGTSTVTVTVATEYGRPTVAMVSGVTCDPGFCNGDSKTLVIRGPLPRINRAIMTLRYTPVAHYYGPDSLHVNVTDHGNTGLGEATRLGE